MLSQNEIEKIPLMLSQRVYELQNSIMEDLVKRLKASGEISSMADWQIGRLKMLGLSNASIKKMLKEFGEFTEKEIDRLYDDVLKEIYTRDATIYSKVGADLIPYEDNKEFQDFVNITKARTAGEFFDFTKTIGFAVKVNGKIQFTEWTLYYQQTLDRGMTELLTGTSDYNSILRKMVAEMTASGIRTVDYASGRSVRVESALRNALMTGFNQTISERNEQIARELETDLFEVSWHGGARPDHQKWQGKVYTMSQLKSICGLGTAEGLKGCNCYHDYVPFVKGASVRNYTDAWVRQQNAKENTPKAYHGKEYTTYEALQQQRKLETLMRKQREEINLLKTGGGDDETIMLMRGKYKATSAQYASFSKAMDLQQQRQRVTVDNLGKV